MTRNIERIILYPGGIVILRDNQGRQAPSLQGQYQDVIENIKQLFKPDEVKWMQIIGNVEVELGYDAWLEMGAKLAKKQLVQKPLSEDIVARVRALGGLAEEDPGEGHSD